MNFSDYAISPENVFLLLAILLISSAIGFWADQGNRLGIIPGIIVAFFIPMVLSTMGIMPESAALYDSIGKYFIPIALPLLLFKSDLREIIAVGRPLLLAFAMAVFATVVGVILGYFLIDLGPDGAGLAGVMAATYIGGSANFLAVATAVEFTDPESLAIAYAADAIGGIFFIVVFGFLPVMPGILKLLPSKIIERASAGEASGINTEKWTKAPPLDLSHLLFAIGISSAICFASEAFAKHLGLDQYFIIIASLFAVIAANLLPGIFRQIDGGFEAGLAMVYIFFGVIGASTNLTHLSAETSLSIILFALIIVGAHLIVTLFLAKLFRIDLATSLVASNAAILGSVMAAAMAQSMNWRKLVMPGLMCGILGMTLANFIGVGVAELLASQ